MYVLWRQLLGDELHMQEISIHMQKEALEAPTKTYIFGHRDNCASFFTSFKIFHECIRLPLNISLLFIDKN